MIEMPQWAIGLICAIGSLLLALIGLLYSRQKDLVNRAERDGGLMSEVKAVGKTVEAMNTTMCVKFGAIDADAKASYFEAGKRNERMIALEIKADMNGKTLDDHCIRIKNLEDK